MNSILGTYKNGNYTVTIYEDGTKIRENDLDNLTPTFAESIDCTITTRCDGFCDFCLTEDNYITINDNRELAISDLKVGNYVLSYDIYLHKFEFKPVLAISERFYEGNLIQLVFENGKRVLCTPEHKIFTTNRGYIRADELLYSDNFIDRDDYNV